MVAADLRLTAAQPVQAVACPLPAEQAITSISKHVMSLNNAMFALQWTLTCPQLCSKTSHMAEESQQCDIHRNVVI